MDIFNKGNFVSGGTVYALDGEYIINQKETRVREESYSQNSMLLIFLLKYINPLLLV